MFLKLLAIVFLLLLVLLFAPLCDARTVITADDIHVSFPDSTNPDWKNVSVVSITESTEPLGTHFPQAKRGPQTWECLVRKEGEINIKAVIVINPDEAVEDGRRMHVRVRYRYVVDGQEDVVGLYWSEPEEVRITGKPQKAVFIR